MHYYNYIILKRLQGHLSHICVHLSYARTPTHTHTGLMRVSVVAAVPRIAGCIQGTVSVRAILDNVV